MEYVVSPGEGVFYGPKIDLHMTDVLGRSWQLGTIQLDYQMPLQFGLTYMGSDNREHAPVVIHRALLGSLERFLGILIEHYGGEFPFWLAPVQVRVLPVGESHREATAALGERLASAGYRVEVDERDETLGKRIREAELEKVPFVIVYGDRESDDALAVRERGGGQATLSLDELLDRFRALRLDSGDSSRPDALPSRGIRATACTDLLLLGLPLCKQERTQLPHLTSATRRGSTEPIGRGTKPLLAAVFVVYEEGIESLVESL